LFTSVPSYCVTRVFLSLVTRHHEAGDVRDVLDASRTFFPLFRGSE